MLFSYLRFTFFHFKHLEAWIYSIPISIFTFHDYECQEYVHILTDCHIYNFMILLFMIYYSEYNIYLIILYFRVTLNSNSCIYFNLILPIYFEVFSPFLLISKPLAHIAMVTDKGIAVQVADTLLPTLGNTILVVTFHNYTMSH